MEFLTEMATRLEKPGWKAEAWALFIGNLKDFHQFGSGSSVADVLSESWGLVQWQSEGFPSFWNWFISGVMDLKQK